MTEKMQRKYTEKNIKRLVASAGGRCSYRYLERKINMTFKWFETEGYIKEIISKAFSFRYAVSPAMKVMPPTYSHGNYNR